MPPENTKDLIDHLKDILTFLIIPAMIWMLKLEVGNAQRDLILDQKSTDIQRLEKRIVEFKAIDTRVQQNALQLARLEGKLDAANDRLDEIRGLLQNNNQ